MMHTAELLEFFKQHRGDAIVIPGRGGRHWVAMNDGPLDLPVGDPAMGGHAGFGLGVALAQPNRKVVLFDSEGDILMSLGMLVTIAEQKPAMDAAHPSANRRRPAQGTRSRSISDSLRGGLTHTQ